MTISSRIDFRQFVVILILLVALYWLLLPGPKKPQRRKNTLELQRASTSELSFGKEKFQVDDIHEKKKHDQIQTDSDHTASEALQNDLKLTKAKLQEKEDAVISLQKEIEKLKKDFSQKEKLTEENILRLQKALKEQGSKNSELNTAKPDAESAKPDVDSKNSEKLQELTKEKQELLKENEELKTKLSTSPQVKMVPFKGRKLVHLDLKGAPPKMGYLVTFVQYCKKLGADGILIEYEDTFPFTGKFEKLKSRNAYSQKDIELLLNVVEEQEMFIIPLVQTFGHLEFFLKHKEFASYRADQEITSSISPVNNQSVTLLKELLLQVANAHPRSKWIHLGGDEVWNLATCRGCVKSGKSFSELYLLHMQPLFEFVTSLKTVDGETRKSIIWDDMLRKWPLNELKAISNFTSPMVWAYVDDLSNYKKFPNGMWKNYTQAFKEIWLASSFKGALKPWSNLPPIRQHLNNHLSWLKITTMLQNDKVNVIGMALTGWSRFDHYGPLCELLPVGVPSLALCLAVLVKGGFNEDIHHKVSEGLGFSSPFTIDLQNLKYYTPEKATYPGSDLYYLAGYLENALGWKDWTNVRYTGWTRQFQIDKNHLSYFQLNQSIAGLSKSRFLLKRLKTKKNLRVSLEKYFDDDTVTEWIEDKIDYNLKIISENIAHIKELFSKISL